MTRHYQIISADGHLEGPPDAWTKYVPERWRDRAPRMIPLPEGGEGWLIEGMPLLHNGQNMTAANSVRFQGASYYEEDGSPVAGAGDAAQRLREQDADGLDCEVLFPPLFSTRFLEGIAEPDVYGAMVRAYNTYLAEEYCSVAPDRLIGSGVIPITGIDNAIEEMRFCHKAGLKAITFYQFPNGSGFASEEDDLFWSEALELGIALAPHVNFGQRDANFGGGARGTAGVAMASSMAQRLANVAPTFCLSQLVYSGVFDRFPDLRLYFAETNAGWMPYFFWMFDDNYRLYKDWYKVELSMKPTEYVTRHCFFGIIMDPVALRLRDHLPVERLMWGSDHPHSVCTYPESRQAIAEIFDGVGEALRRRILLENPAEYFGLDLARDLTPTP